MLRVRLMEIAALAGNGHTHVGSGEDTSPAALPIRVAQFSDGLRVLRAQDAYADLLGARVETVGGHPIDDALERLGKLRGGLPGWSHLTAEFYVVLQDILYGTRLATASDSSTWTFRLHDGSEVTRVLPAHKPVAGELDAPITRLYSTEPAVDLKSGWKTYETAKPLPLSLQNYSDNFRRIWLPRSCTLFLQMKAIMDADGQSFSNFLNATESELKARHPCAMIVDLRYSIGGDFTQVQGFGKRLPGYLGSGGNIYILTSSNTFSATIGAAAAIKEAAGDRAIVLGEPIGDNLDFFSEGGRGCLPNFHICFDYATGKNDFSLNRCDDWNVCFWPGWLFPIHTKSLAPDEIVTTSFDQWNDGHDPVFERAIALAGKH